MNVLSQYFGNLRYDVKTMMKPCCLYGGLNVIANHFKVERVSGKSSSGRFRQFVTMQVFMNMKSVYFQCENAKVLNKLACIQYGLNRKVDDEKDQRTTSSSKSVTISPFPHSRSKQ